MRVKVNKNNYFYPDIVIVCGDLRKDKRGNLLNPLVVIEVLSPSTQDYDLGAKLKAYLALPGLQEYLVIHQDKVQVTHYWRDEAGWRVEVVSELAGAVSLPSLGLSLPLGEAYKRVAFEPEEGGAFDDDTPPDGDEA
jgi:Uma2 family endonuclease